MGERERDRERERDGKRDRQREREREKEMERDLSQNVPFFLIEINHTNKCNVPVAYLQQNK